MTAGGRLGSIRFRAFGQFQRDARLILVVSLVTGAAVSLYWIDFNLYLASLGYETATIGLVSTIASIAGALIAFPASAASDRVGRRAIIAAGTGVGLMALIGLIMSDALPLIIVSVALWSAGGQAVQVVMSPYMT
ncbi:MAG: MFS transporter, partial [Candidatus Limnocylindrales bacterium]